MSGAGRQGALAIFGGLFIVLGLAAVAAGTLRSAQAFDKLGHDALHSFSRVRDLDEIFKLARGSRAADRAAAVRLVQEALDASDEPDAHAALLRAKQCLAQDSCSPGLEVELKPAEKGYLARVSSEYESAQRRADEGRWAALLGAAVALVGAALALSRGWRAAPLPPEPHDERPLQEVFKSRLEELYQVRLHAWENDRFAAYGELAAGLSHGLKTPLSTIRAAAQVAQVKLGPQHPAAANLDDIVGEIDALVDQVRRFLKATGSGLPVPVPIHPRRILDALDRAYGSDTEGRGVAFRVVTEEGVPEVSVDPALLEMALRNVVENAFAVSPHGGSVTATARPCEAPDRAGLDKARPAAGGRWAEIAIADQGPGLPAQVAAGGRVESSKPEGSGLGLAIARQIVARHGGVLVFSAGPAGGTVVRAVLPAAQTPALARAE